MPTGLELHFGVEEEFALLYPDGSLANEADALLARVPARYTPDRVKRDLHYCIVETTTPVCPTPAAVEASLKELRAVVGEAAAGLNLRVISSGVHPTAPMEQGRLVETPRFQRLIRKGALRGDGVHFGLHLHVSLDGPERRAACVNRLRWHIPEMASLGVNSPFYLGRYHDVKSTRLEYYDPVPTVGPPPVISSFQEWDAVLKSFAAYGVEGERDYYGDIRHRYTYPTVEIRIMDTQQAVGDTMAVAAYVWALIRHYASQAGEEALPPMREEELRTNRQGAWRAGLAGDYVLYGERVARQDYIRHIIGHLLAQNGPEAPYLERLDAMVAAGRTGADRQLELSTAGTARQDVLLQMLTYRFAEGI